MPNKRHEQRPIDFLNREEIEALLAIAGPAPTCAASGKVENSVARRSVRKRPRW